MSNIIDEREIKEAEKEANLEAEMDTFVYNFAEPVEWEGRTIESLTFNFGQLTGNDFEKIEEELNAEGKYILSPEFSSPFLIRMAVRACKENIDDAFIRKQSIGLYNQIRSKGRSFLLRAGQ